MLFAFGEREERLAKVKKKFSMPATTTAVIKKRRETRLEFLVLHGNNPRNETTKARAIKAVSRAKGL